jgi:hypothetical protein
MTTTALPVPTPALPPDHHPAAAYLASLAPSSRRTQGEALDAIARLLGAADRRTLPWHRLGPQHVVYVREALAARLAPPTTNRHLCALRRVLRWAWRLGLMHVEAYQRAADVQNVTGSTLRAGWSSSGSPTPTGCSNAVRDGTQNTARCTTPTWRHRLNRARLVSLSSTAWPLPSCGTRQDYARRTLLALNCVLACTSPDGSSR